MIEGIIDFISKPFASVVGGWQARKNMAAESEQRKIESDLQLKEATNNALIQRVQTADDYDFALDLKAMENRKDSKMDDFLIAFWVVVISLHFVPAMQPYMLGGWDALSRAPTWFQIGVVIIMITTMGGMRILRLLIERGNVRAILGIK